MKPAPKKVRERKPKKTYYKAFIVSGVWGITLATPHEHIAKKEYQRLKRGEFNPSIVTGFITYSAPKIIRTKKTK